MTEKIEKIELDITAIVLVGLCNGEVRSQTLIGIIFFRKGEDGKLEPCLYTREEAGELGSAKTPFRPNFSWKMKGQYGLCFPDVARGHGVMLMLDNKKGEYKFVTGIHPYDSGSSGPLSHGGPELVDALDELFYS